MSTLKIILAIVFGVGVLAIGCPFLITIAVLITLAITGLVKWSNA